MQLHWCWGLGAVAVCALVGCGGGGGDGDGGTDGRVHAPSTCEAQDEAPLRDGMGGFECVRVGAQDATLEDGWPVVGGLAEPTVYVRPGEDGDGSKGAPFGSIADALGADPGSIVLSEGRYELGATLEVTEGELAVVGAGSMSVLVAPDGDAGVRASGETTTLSLTTLAVEGGEPGIHVLDGATVTLEDVTVEDAVRGVRVDSATVTATRLTVRRSVEVSVRLGAQSDGMLRESLLRDGEEFGIVARDSHLSLEDSFVTRHGRDGIALLGGIEGRTHVVHRVTSSFNGVTAMRAEGAMTVVDASLLGLTGTRVPEGDAGGDGLFVGGGATVRLDAEIESDAKRGHGSELVGNARTGALVSDDGTVADIAGALVGSNRGPGIFLQLGAHGDEVGYSRIEDNESLGIGIASGAASDVVPCNFIVGTRKATLDTTEGPFEVGDGLSITEATGEGTLVIGNTLSDNERFGVVVAGSTATLQDNVGTGNQWGLGVYESDAALESNTIEGAETAPDGPPATARGALVTGATP